MLSKLRFLSLTIFSFIAVLFFANIAFSAPAFQPGQTLDPTTCSPGGQTAGGDDCTVGLGWSLDLANDYVYNTTDSIGIGTATPDHVLDVTSSTSGDVFSASGPVATGFTGWSGVSSDFGGLGFNITASGSSYYETATDEFNYVLTGDGAVLGQGDNAAIIGWANLGGDDKVDLRANSSGLRLRATDGTNQTDLTISDTGGFDFVGSNSGTDQVFRLFNSSAQTLLRINGNGTTSGLISLPTSTSDYLLLGAGNTGANVTTASATVSLGPQSGVALTSGQSNTFIGAQAGNDVVDGSFNTFIGSFSGANTTSGNSNTFIGIGSGQQETTGVANTSIGSVSLPNIVGSNNNLAFGAGSGFGLRTGNNNIFIGSNTGVEGEAISGSITYTSGSAAITGTGTSFLSEVSVGDILYVGDSSVAVSAIASDTALTLVTAVSSSGTDNDPEISSDTGIGNSILLGNGARATSGSQMVINGIVDSYIGNGVTNASPTSTTINATGGLGTNVTGANLSIASGKGTGNASGGDIVFLTSNAGSSGSGLQALSQKAVINNTGDFYLLGADRDPGNSGPVISTGYNEQVDAVNDGGAGSVNFRSRAGTNGYVWQDAAGNLRINNSAPTNANDAAGTVVGAQSSTRDTKQDITSYNNAEALSLVLDVPLHSFRYIKDVKGYGEDSPLSKVRIGYIADEVGPEFMVGNVIDQVSVNGLLIGSVQALQNQIDGLSFLETVDSGDTANAFDVIGNYLKSGTEKIINGVLRVKEMIADKITTKELCVEDICVDRDTFKAMVEQAGGVASSSSESSSSNQQSSSSSSSSSNTESEETPDENSDNQQESETPAQDVSGENEEEEIIVGNPAEETQPEDVQNEDEEVAEEGNDVESAPAEPEAPAIIEEDEPAVNEEESEAEPTPEPESASVEPQASVE